MANYFMYHVIKASPRTQLVCLTLLITFCATACLAATNSLATDSTNNTTHCPTWYIPKESSNGSTVCKCGSTLYNEVWCNVEKQEVSIINGYCMTYDENNTDVVVGPCSYSNNTIGYSTLPQNTSDLNEYMCGPTHREGQLCGGCKPGYGHGITTYTNKCVKCTSRGYVAAFIATQAVLATAFFLFIIIFRVNVSSGAICVFVFYSQTISLPPLAFSVQDPSGEVLGSGATTLANVLVSVYGVWNFQFFLPFMPEVCLHRNLTGPQALAMPYLLPAYLLFLTLTVYIGIELHAHNCRPIVFIWKPFHRCLVRFRRRWNIRLSVVDAFATLLHLSYINITFISIRLLHLVKPNYSSGKQTSKAYMLYDPTVEYAGKEHFPFLLMSLLLLATVGIAPIVILTFYQFRWFQKCLDICRLNRQGLRAFVEVFQGCYQNGVVGRCDCRYFAGLYLIIRLVVNSSLPRFTSLTSADTITSFFYTALFVSVSAMFALLRPFRRNLYNIINTSFFAGFAILVAGMSHLTTMVMMKNLNPSTSRTSKPEIAIAAFCFILWSLPAVYFAVVVLYWVCLKLKITSRLPLKSFHILSAHSEMMLVGDRTPLVTENSVNMDQSISLPDRVLNPSRYQSL